MLPSVTLYYPVLLCVTQCYTVERVRDGTQPAVTHGRADLEQDLR